MEGILSLGSVEAAKPQANGILMTYFFPQFPAVCKEACAICFQRDCQPPTLMVASTGERKAETSAFNLLNNFRCLPYRVPAFIGGRVILPLDYHLTQGTASEKSKAFLPSNTMKFKFSLARSLQSCSAGCKYRCLVEGSSGSVKLG